MPGLPGGKRAVFTTSFRNAHQFQSSQLERAPSRKSPSLQVSSPPNANRITHSLCVSAGTTKLFFYSVIRLYTRTYFFGASPMAQW